MLVILAVHALHPKCFSLRTKKLLLRDNKLGSTVAIEITEIYSYYLGIDSESTAQ